MKKNSSRRILLVVVALFAAAVLVVVSAAASVFAYRQFADNPRSKVDSLIEGLQVSKGDQEKNTQAATEGVLILRVEPGSPAEAAGLSAGTVIVGVNGRSVGSPQELKETIAEFEVGDTVTLTIQNGEESEDIAVTLGDSGPYLGVNVGDNRGTFRFHGRGLGEMDGFVMPHIPGHPAMPGDPQAPEDMMPFEFHFDEFAGQSALVMSVEEASPASEAGLQPGDAVVEANGQSIGNSQQLIDLIGGLSPGDELSLQVQRGDETLSFDITLSSHPEDGDLAFLGVFLAPTMMPRDMEFFQDQQNS